MDLTAVTQNHSLPRILGHQIQIHLSNYRLFPSYFGICPLETLFRRVNNPAARGSVVSVGRQLFPSIKASVAVV